MKVWKKYIFRMKRIRVHSVEGQSREYSRRGLFLQPTIYYSNHPLARHIGHTQFLIFTFLHIDIYNLYFFILNNTRRVLGLYLLWLMALVWNCQKWNNCLHLIFIPKDVSVFSSNMLMDVLWWYWYEVFHSQCPFPEIEVCSQ